MLKQFLYIKWQFQYQSAFVFIKATNKIHSFQVCFGMPSQRKPKHDSTLHILEFLFCGGQIYVFRKDLFKTNIIHISSETVKCWCIFRIYFLSVHTLWICVFTWHLVQYAFCIMILLLYFLLSLCLTFDQVKLETGKTISVRPKASRWMMSFRST